ncbi:MAG: DNA polymerase III subunit chi [Gammaproteobacteria bacterium]
MTRIDFYILGSTGTDDRPRLACRLAEKAWRAGHRVYINASTHGQAQMLDQMLWTFRDQSFVPHALASADPDAPVVIGFETEPNGPADTLINLAGSVPPFFSRFDRTLELVDADSERRAQSRERFKFYRDRGYHLETHKL